MNWTPIWLPILCILLTEIHSSRQASTTEPDSYLAAVVEYPGKLIKNDGPATLQENTKEFLRHIKKAGEENVDIIVFPENGLTTLTLPGKSQMLNWTIIVPSAADNCTPCTSNSSEISDTLKKISCAAKEHRVYVVINIAETFTPTQEDKCSESDEIRYYNTNVVFDRNGKIIARYRKTHLFMEPQFSIMKEPEIVTFDTDFGVKFGTFICFDILFKEPALNLTRLQGVTDIAYPTAWFSELPFLTAIQTQFGWAFSEDVNLLAAGYNYPLHGNSGSGIYLGRKGLATAILPRIIHNEMLVFRVPKVKPGKAQSPKDGGHGELQPTTAPPSSRRIVHDELRFVQSSPEDTDYLTLLQDDFRVYETVVFNGTFAETICYGDFCCDFKIEASSVDPKTEYRMVVFDGIRYYGKYAEAGIRVCSLIQCLNNTIASCGSAEKSETKFTTIEITGKYDAYDDSLVFPNVLDSSLLPFQNWNYEDQRHEDHMHVTMSLKSATNNVVTFGLYCRDFRRDSINASAHVVPTILTLISFLIICLRL